MPQNGKDQIEQTAAGMQGMSRDKGSSHAFAGARSTLS